MDNQPEVRPHDLLPGERVLWSGRPKSGLRMEGRDFVNLPFGIVFTGFALFWTTMAFSLTRSANTPTPFRIFFPLFGVPFMLAGLWVMFGSIIARSIHSKKTAYAITERRIITVIEGGNRTVTSIDLERILSTTLTEGKDGIGSISYSISSRDLERLRIGGRLSNPLNAMTLESIADAASAYRTLESARAARKSVVGEVDP